MEKLTPHLDKAYEMAYDLAVKCQANTPEFNAAMDLAYEINHIRTLAGRNESELMFSTLNNLSNIQP